MKKLFLFSFIFFGSYTYACPEVLDHEVRLLDSSETQNLCEYENKVILAVNVASRCGSHISMKHCKTYTQNMAKKILLFWDFLLEISCIKNIVMNLK